MSEYVSVIEEKVCPLPTEVFKERRTWTFNVVFPRLRYSHYYRETLKSPRHRKWDLKESLVAYRMSDQAALQAAFPEWVVEDALRQARERIKFDNS